MLRCTSTAFLINLTIVLAPVTALAKPLVPILSFLQHWDHHRYVWLPGDSLYEAVEVMATERGPQGPLVWVFFTERAPLKNQANYYNDARQSLRVKPEAASHTSCRSALR